MEKINNKVNWSNVELFSNVSGLPHSLHIQCKVFINQRGGELLLHLDGVTDNGMLNSSMSPVPFINGVMLSTS